MAGHRYWSITNISNRDNTYPVRNVATLRFNNKNNVISNNTNNGFSNSHPSDKPQRNGYAAFDNDPSTLADADSNSANSGFKWRIWYVFDEPQEVISISCQMRQDMQSSWGWEWQTADVEYSDDGINWVRYGNIQPKIAAMDVSLKTVDIIRPLAVMGKSLQDNGKASRFVLIHDWESGSFIQKVVPSTDGSWSYSPPNANKLIITHIGEEGFAPQTDAPITPV